MASDRGASPPPQATARKPRWQAAGLALLLAGVTLLPGCTVRVGGERSVSEENQRLREQNLALERQAADLEQQLNLRAGEVEALRQQLAAEHGSPAIEGAQPPTLARLTFGRLSGPVDTDGDDRHDLIRIYLRPLDQRGRLMPVAGRATVRAAIIPDQGDPQVVAERIYQPDDFDRAWREGFTGTHYTLELPLPDTLPEGETELTVRVGFLEAEAGVRLAHQEAMTVRQ
ncbi:MAG: hypothetical protein WDZ31_01415 [Phycisphaeraceae bacterium]